MNASRHLEAVLEYADRGWPALPCEPRGKRPLGRLVPHGLKEASTDPAVIRKWWEVEPEANIGLATGIAFDVLDVDGDDGMRALSGALPLDAATLDGPTVTTGRGAHVYLAVTGIGNRAGLVPHVDFRGRGGYVIAPPSLHPSGTRYRWHLGEADPDFGANAPLQAAPRWLLDLLEPALTPFTPRGSSNRPAQSRNAYARRALESEVGRIALAEVGERNDVLNRAAFALGQLVAGRAIGVDEVIDSLLVAAERCGLELADARRTIASGLQSGARQPRRAS